MEEYFDLINLYMIALKLVCGMKSTWYVADAKSVWSWMKIVESSAEFLCK